MKNVSKRTQRLVTARASAHTRMHAHTCVALRVGGAVFVDILTSSFSRERMIFRVSSHEENSGVVTSDGWRKKEREKVGDKREEKRDKEKEERDRVTEKL